MNTSVVWTRYSAPVKEPHFDMQTLEQNNHWKSTTRTCHIMLFVVGRVQGHRCYHENDCHAKNWNGIWISPRFSKWWKYWCLDIKEPSDFFKTVTKRTPGGLEWRYLFDRWRRWEQTQCWPNYRPGRQELVTYSPVKFPIITNITVLSSITWKSKGREQILRSDIFSRCPEDFSSIFCFVLSSCNWPHSVWDLVRLFKIFLEF